MRWAYGITTVPQRFNSVLPRTILSLKSAGFESPHLFVDGNRGLSTSDRFGLEVTAHSSGTTAFGNWVVALWTLYVKNPNADRYAIFQDDLVTYRNLRKYLDKCRYPKKGYWNLYNYPINQAPPPNDEYVGWSESNQMGRGALALVFDRPTVTTLLQQQYLVSHPQNPSKGHRCIDGVVVTSLKNAGWSEYIHFPSLVLHTGESSTLENKGYREPAESFLGEKTDAISFLEKEND